MKKYWFNVVEEAVLNPDYAGYRAARVEVFENDSTYAIYEARVLLPTEFFDDFYELFDLKESDLMPRIIWEAK